MASLVPVLVRFGLWWLLVGREHPRPVNGCADKEGCSADGVVDTDVYCREHDGFLPWGGAGPSRRAITAVNVVRGAVCAAFVATASWDSAVPMWAVGVLAGTAVAVLPLRLYRASAAFAAGLWIAAAGVVLGLWFAQPDDRATMVVTVIAAVLAGWLAYTGVMTWHVGKGSHVAGAERGVRAVAATMAATPPAAVGCVVIASAREALLVVAIGGVTGAALLAVVIGAVGTRGRIDKHVGVRLGRPAKPHRLRWDLPETESRSDRSAGPVDRVARAVNQFLYGLVAFAVTIAAAAASLIILLVYFLAIAAIAAINLILRRTIVAWRRMRLSVINAAVVVWAAARLLCTTIIGAVRVVLVPLVLTASAAVTMMWWAEFVRWYLTEGSLAALSGLAMAATSASVALTLVWMALTAAPVRQSADSALHNAGAAIAHGMLLLAAGGWALGILGLLGHSPITPGWLTIGATILLAAATLGAPLFKHPVPGPPDIEHSTDDPANDATVDGGRVVDQAGPTSTTARMLSAQDIKQDPALAGYSVSPVP